MLGSRVRKMERVVKSLRNSITWARRNRSTYILGLNERFDHLTVDEAEDLVTFLERHLAAARYGWGYVDNRIKLYGKV